MLKLGILGSTRGTALQGVIDAIAQGQLDAEIKLVLSNKVNAGILQRAEAHNIPHHFVSKAQLSRQAYDEKLSQLMHVQEVDLILLVGYMRILSQSFTQQWADKVINVHPSLLPKHAGLMDLAVHQAVLDAGDKESGCTIHFVNDVVDGGDILLQKKCLIDENETANSLKEKVQALEKIAFVEAITVLDSAHKCHS